MSEVANTTQINNQQGDMVALIGRVVSDPNIDIDKLERFINMRNDELTRLAKVNFNKAMSAAQAEIKPVAKDATNNHTRSKYATYEAISEAIQPVIDKYGFAISYNEGKSELDGFVKLICTVSHGEYEKQFEANIPLDGAGAKGNSNKNATQAYGSTIAYGRRYLKAMIFDVAVTDEDDDAQNASISNLLSKDDITRLTDAINEHGIDIAAFCQYFKVSALSEIKLNDLGRAWGAIQSSIKKKAKEQANG